MCMDVISYLLGKKSGGGGGSLQEKSVTITENGTTNILPDENYNGMSKVSVTTDIIGGAIKEKDVNFFDYNGDLLYSYTKNEFANLSELPENPTHEGLTSQGWNWTLSDAKTYLSKYEFLDIGQLYKPNDNKTHIFVTLYEDKKNPYVGFAVNGTATIEWGDGEQNTVTGTSTNTIKYTQHNYSKGGNYEIKISSDTNIYFSGNNNSSYLLVDNPSPSYSNIYLECVKKIYVNSNVYINLYGFNRLYKLKNIIVPKDIFHWETGYAFQYCYCLEFINLGETLGTGYMFTSCSSLKGYTATSLRYGTSTFDNCLSLKRAMLTEGNSTEIFNGFASNTGIEKIQLTDNYVQISLNIISNTSRLKKIVMPANVTSIKDNFPTNNATISKIDFSRCNAIPTLTANTVSLPPYCRAVVPDELYEDWIVADKWSNLATKIIKASDYVDW